MSTLATKAPISVPLSDLAIAPENMRIDDDVDDGVEALAESLLAGQILPLFVRAAPDMLRPWAVLDGRRRLLAYQHLDGAGLILPDHAIQVVVCETPAEIAAATVITNSERLEISPADYLLAVHRLTQQFKSADDIAGILGIPAKRVRQYAKLGGLDRRFLDAYRNKQLNMPTLRRLARVTDPEAIEALADQLAENGYLGHYEIEAALSSGLAADTPLAAVIGVEAYVKAGGTVDQDLFEETADRLTDRTLLNRLWVDLTLPMATYLREQGLTVHVDPDNAGAPEGYVRLPYNWQPLPGLAEAIKEGEDKAAKLGSVCAGLRQTNDPAYAPWSQDYAAAVLEFTRLRFDPLTVAAARIRPAQAGIVIDMFVAQDELEAYHTRELEAREAAANDTDTGQTATSTAPKAPEVKIDTEGFQHGLHEQVTHLAGLAMAVSVLNNPAAAFDLQLASQFLEYAERRWDKLLNLSLPFSLPATSNDRFVQPIVERFNEYRDLYRASGLHAISWVRTLTSVQKGDLLAAITAASISTREARTDQIRKQTRIEAAHLADALDYDVRDVWTPDAAFYGLFNKRQLLAFLVEMGGKTRDHDKLKREELAPIVAELAKEKDWVPPQLNFELLGKPEPLIACKDGDMPDDQDTAIVEEAAQ